MTLTATLSAVRRTTSPDWGPARHRSEEDPSRPEQAVPEVGEAPEDN